MLWFKIGLVVFATIPVLNKHVFKIENLAMVKLEIQQSLLSMNEMLGEGDYAGVREAATELEERVKGNSDPISKTGMQLALLNAGNSFSFEGNHQAAIVAYKRILDEYPESDIGEVVLRQIASSYYKLGISETDAKDQTSAFNNAIEYNTKIVLNREKASELPMFKNMNVTPNVYPPREQTYIEDVIIDIGKCYLKMGQADKARESFQIAAEYFPGSATQDDALKYIGDSYLEQGVAEKEALESETDPQKRKVLQYDSEKHLRNALLTYQNFVNKYGQSEYKSDVMISLGETYFHLGENQKGLDTFGEAVSSISVPGKQAEVQLRIGNYYYKVGDFGKAIEEYSKVIKNFPDAKVAPNAQYKIAKSYAEMNDTQNEFIAYEKLTEYYKTSIFYAPAAYMLGKRCRERQEYNEALKYFKKGITLHPSSSVAHKTQYMIGLTQLDMQNYRQAIREFEYLFGEYEGRLRQDEAENAWLQMATCYKNLDEMDKAHEVINRIQSHSNKIEAQKILGIDANDPDAKIAKWEEELGGGSDETDASVLFEIGKILAKDKREYETALEKYAEAEMKTADPVKKRNIVYFRGVALFALKRYVEARDVFNAMIADTDTPAEMRLQCEFKVYDSYRREGQYDKAIEGFNAFIEAHVNDDEEHFLMPYARFMVGNSLKDKGEYDAAIETYNLIIDDPGLGDDAALAIGNCYKESGRVDEAISYWLDYLAKNPDVESASQMYYQIGEAYRTGQGNLSAAIDNYRIVFEQYPESYLLSASAYQAGMALIKLKQPQEARKVLELVKKEDRSFYRAARAEIGKIMAAVDYKAAINEYEQIEVAGESDDDRALARMGIGDIYYNKKMYREASESFLTVIEQYLDAEVDLVAGAYIKLVDSYGNLKQYKDAIRYSDMMIEKYPDNAYTINAYYFKANALYALKQYKSAIKIFRQIMDLDRNPALTEISMYQSAECLMVQGLHDPAIAAYDRFVKKYPKSQYTAIAIYQQGNAYWAKEDWNRAFVKFKKIYDTYPDFSEYDQAMAFLAYCYDKRNEWQAAKRLYQQVIRRNKSKNAVKFAQGYLEQLNLTH